MRILGNDAAHVESQVYKEIGREKVELAIRFTIELLKALYQVKKLVEDIKKLKTKEDHEP